MSEDASNIVKLALNVTELANKASSGIGWLFDFFMGKEKAQRDAHAVLTMAQAQRDAESILAGESFLVVNEDGSQTIIENPARNLLSAKVTQEIENLLLCLKSAFQEMQGKQIDTKLGSVSETFLSRWRQEAQFISEEYVQEFWGKLLAAEVETPKSIGLRSLDILKTVDETEAILFDRLTKHVVNGDFVAMAEGQIDPVQGISQADLKLLEDAQLISHTVDITSDYQRNSLDSSQLYRTSMGNYGMGFVGPRGGLSFTVSV
ncbi:DUF2806 domain-containing protein [Oxalobacter vibrioformis]|uniref:DUF2806 domain-containing protein n=1 Tax=Oxalobacter vibrioformis TaxID=933080 RepID=A0A9E9P2X1_9BURK|nr:DUF2806 domain-containing protein [Oxalobacter vibrioformis]WAW10364.1 DUF2806 domain-containing protein [Oxalobacter vibrioformis]